MSCKKRFVKASTCAETSVAVRNRWKGCLNLHVIDCDTCTFQYGRGNGRENWTSLVISLRAAAVLDDRVV